MLQRFLLIILVLFSLTLPAYGQGPPPEALKGLETQQDQAARALEKEKARPDKIGNLSQGSLVDNFKKGGIIMYFILACSIIGIYVTIERTFSLQRSRILPRKFINNILSIISTAPPRLQNRAQPYPPNPSYPPINSGGYPPAPPSSPPQTNHDPTTSSQASPQPPPPTPEQVPPQDTSGEAAPSDVDRELKTDMDQLINILNKGLGDVPAKAGSEESPSESPESDSTTTAENDPNKGGQGSEPMNMSYPAGASLEENPGAPPSGGYGSDNPGGGGYYPPPTGPPGQGGDIPDVVDQITDYCEGKNIPLARVLKSGLLVYNEGILSIKSAITNANLHEGAIMEKGVGALGVMANVAPLLGLLGTVTGMIKAFEMISVGGTGRPEIVASGIAEALTTTAGGLFVGIPLLLLFHWLQGKIENMLIDLQEFSVDVMEKIVREGK